MWKAQNWDSFDESFLNSNKSCCQVTKYYNVPINISIVEHRCDCHIDKGVID